MRLTAEILTTLLLVVPLWFTPEGSAIERRVPQIPPAHEKIRVIIDTDAACEIDDQYAIALAVLSPERFEIEGFVAAHFGDSGGPNGVQDSADVIARVLDKAGLANKFPIKRGSDPFQYSRVPVPSEGVDFILQRAFASDDKRPLWIISLGACTDVASAYLKRPEISERVIVLWHGRTRWPDKAWNFNVYNDLKAARILFSSDVPLVFFDTGTYLRCPIEESREKMRPHGQLGEYLHDFRLTKPYYQSPKKGFFDLGDVAALLDPSLVYWEVVKVPGIQWDMKYDRSKSFGDMVRIYQIDRDRTFGLFFQKLAQADQQR
jgi:inosine-uridine nucleoside N-ribohydrolase